MRHFFSKYKLFLTLFGLVSLVILGLFYRALSPQKTLPIYQPAMVNFELVDSTLQHVKKFHKIADFSLTNQNGETVTHQQLDGKIYIADFIFTTCPTICPVMTENMLTVQKTLKDNPRIHLISFSVTPEIDSVPRLKAYALEKGIDDEKWDLLTGDKKAIYRLARQSYLVAKEDGDGGPYDMIHTENFVLVDPQRRIRGYYDGTDLDAISSLLKDVVFLEKEFFEN
jgi:protein SCO1/2